jgi:putative FmdB family regulatory protein
MPTYDYECTKCGKLFERFQSITAKELQTIETDCRECSNNAPVVRRIGGGAGIIFKGSGFYQTDYRSESYKKAAKSESGADAKPSGESGSKPEKKETAAKPKNTPAPKSETNS